MFLRASSFFSAVLSRRSRLAVALALAAAGLCAPSVGPSMGAEGEKAPASSAASVFTPEQRKAIEQIVKDYLIANPEVFVEIQGALESRMEAVQAEKLKTAIAQHAAEIYRRQETPTAGNPKGDVPVVEFFDYNCGYCKRGFPSVAKLVEHDPKVRLVMMELPILSKGSEEASRVALAARKQGKYWEFHRAMFEHRGQANEASALKIAEKLGLDMTRLKKDMEAPDIGAELTRVRDLADKMGINGTPHFLVGDRSIPGAPEDLYDQLNSNVAEIRKSGCPVC